MQVGRVNPIFVAGDSQSIVYGDRVYIDGECSYVTRTLHCGLHAGDLADEHGTLYEPFVVGLRGARLALPVNGRLEACHVSGAGELWALTGPDQRQRADPPIVFACGHLDLSRIARDLPFDDFALPDDIAQHFNVPPVCLENDGDGASAFDMRTLAHTRLMTFRIGLRVLRRLGFGRLAVLSLAPFGTDDAQFAQLADVVALPGHARRLALKFRYKLVLLMNSVLEQLCREEGIDFLNRWPEQTSGGIVRAGVLHDQFHISSAEADRGLPDLVRWAEATRATETVPAQP